MSPPDHLRQGREPAYRKISRELREQLLQRSYDGGQRLPTEAELAVKHAVSRQTIRRAFQELVSDGLVYRVPGRGTFSVPRGGQYLRQYGSVEDLMHLTEGSELEVIEPLRERVNLDAASRLRLASDSVFTLSFRRLRDSIPYCHTWVYLSPKVGRLAKDVPELAEKGRVSQATIIGVLDAKLEDPIAEAEQSITAAGATEMLAGVLNCEVATPLLRIDRLYFSSTGEAVELAVSHFLPENYSYRVRLRRGFA